jgi:ectoine hydroxylase-related dioxygenase (phytanoyl-CoA dioxygenase family)
VSTRRPPPSIETVEDLYQDLAGTHALARRAPANPRELETDLAAMKKDGFVALERIIGAEENNRAKDAIDALLGPAGRNAFEGYKTQRAYSLLKKTRALDSLVAHPRILAILDALIGPDPLLSANLAIRINPGETQQVAHFDAGFYPGARPRAPIALSVIWAIDPFTEENGATVIWPGSHLWGDDRKPTDADPHHPVVMPAGSAVIFDGDFWHAGGANRSSASRLALTPQYCANWLRTMENMALAIPPEIVASLSDDLQSLMGYAIRPPFMGHVNGMHPKRLLE